MEQASIYQDVEYNDNRPVIKVLFETTFTKEIRIAMKAGTMMKKHQTPFPIVVEIVAGEIDFGVDGTIHNLKKGSLVALDGGVPHDLAAIDDSIIRLTLTKSDQTQRVEKVISE